MNSKFCETMCLHNPQPGPGGAFCTNTIITVLYDSVSEHAQYIPGDDVVSSVQINLQQN